MDNGVEFRSDLFNDYLTGYENLTQRQKNLEPDTRDEGQLLDEIHGEVEKLQEKIRNAKNEEERRSALEEFYSRNYIEETDNIVRYRASINQSAQGARAEVEKIKNAKKTVLDNAEKAYNQEKERLTSLLEKLENTPGVKDQSIYAAIDQAQKDLRNLERDWKLFNIRIRGIDKENGFADLDNSNRNINQDDPVAGDKGTGTPNTTDTNKNNQQKASNTTRAGNQDKADSTTTPQTGTNGEWGPLSQEEIDDAKQLGFTDYTPGDNADFDRFLIDHGYNPYKLKEEKDSITRNSDNNKGWGPLTPEEIDDAIQLGFTEYTPGDNADFDRFLIDHGYNPDKLKARTNKTNQNEPSKDDTDTKKNNPDQNKDDQDQNKDDSKVDVNFTNGRPIDDTVNKGTRSNFTDGPAPIATDIKFPERSEKTVYTVTYNGEVENNDQRYSFSEIKNGVTKNTAPFTRFKEAEVKSARKRLKIMTKDEDIKKLLEAHPEISKKLLKKADPTLLKSFASNENFDYAMAYLNKLSTGNIAKDGDSFEFDDMVLKYDVKVDDPNFAFMRKMAKSHKDVAEVSIPSLWERLKYKLSQNNKALPEAEEQKKLEAGKETAKDKEPEVEPEKTQKKSWELTNEEKEEAESITEKITRAKRKKEERMNKRLSMSQEDFRASLDEEDLAMFDALTTDKERIAFRRLEPNERYTFANREETEQENDKEQ